MTESVTFIVGALALLATPGPTNTLLATSGAAKGFRKSLELLLGELLGYLLAIAVLRAALGPVIVAMPAFGVALGAVVCVYLLYLASMLWRHSELQMAGAHPVTLQRVFMTTLLNPKAVIFAFTLLPSSVSAGEAGLLPWVSALSLLIVTIGACWVAIGASLKRRIHETAGPQLGYRAGAVVLVLLAGIIGGRVIGIA